MLRRALSLSNDNIRTAWCWFDLATTLQLLDESYEGIETAYLNSIAVLPNENHFTKSYENWKRNVKQKRKYK